MILEFIRRLILMAIIGPQPLTPIQLSHIVYIRIFITVKDILQLERQKDVRMRILSVV